MEMHQVRYFLAVCKTLNFTRAAERCNVAQPSLTRAIQKLEEELGGPLFRRERNRTHLTELGRLMLPHLRALRDASMAASAEAEDYHKLEKAPLRLGIMCTIGPARLVNFLARLHREIPSLELQLQEAPGAPSGRRSPGGRARCGDCEPAELRGANSRCTALRRALPHCFSLGPSLSGYGGRAFEGAQRGAIPEAAETASSASFSTIWNWRSLFRSICATAASGRSGFRPWSWPASAVLSCRNTCPSSPAFRPASWSSRTSSGRSVY